MGETLVTPRRSVLYVAGADSLALAKARTLSADAVIFDLEDAVAPRVKAQARIEVMTALGAGGYAPRECAVRINALDSAWGRDDLAAAATSGANAVVLPKVESAAEVCRAARLLEAAAAPPAVTLWAMIETPRGVLHAEEIAGSNPRLACLVLGSSDLTANLRARHTRDRLALLASGSLVVLAARAAGIGAIDGVHLDLGDEEGFEAECRQGRELGFDGKTLIHSAQISVANRVFAPSDSEADWAMRIVLASESAATRGLGAVVLDGRLIENLRVSEARRVLALQDAIRRLERATTEGLFSA